MHCSYLKKEEDWKNWKWQIKNSVRDIESFEMFSGVSFSQKDKQYIQKTIEQFPLSITPYYISLIDSNNYVDDPIFRQCFPSTKELDIAGADHVDPLSEDADSPVKHITHRYPDRVLFHISNKCAMYCRHCTRKRKVGDADRSPKKKELLNGIEYIKNTPEIRDVLLSGGDPFMLSDEFIDWLLTEIEKIPHVEIIRIGTRVPVVLPFRITDKLTGILKRRKPLWLNTHFNHPNELSAAATQALSKLADAGIPLGNQSVLLAGVNDCVRIMKELVHKLVQNRVRPYYLYQCDLSTGLSHFRTPISKGIEIIEGLRGHTSGMAVPTFVVDAPGGGGKIPLMPQYQLSNSPNKVVLRNYEGIITTYEEPLEYEHRHCDLDCHNCSLFLKLDAAKKVAPVGIKKLLSDFDDEISLIPKGNERIEKRSSEDVTTRMGDTIFQHGKNSNRVYMMHLGNENPECIIEQIQSLASAKGYSKILFKAPARVKPLLESRGYVTEARIPTLYRSGEDGFFLARYLSDERQHVANRDELDAILLQCLEKRKTTHPETYLPYGCLLTKGKAENAPQLAELYRQIFESYPFPIHQKEYIENTMKDGSEYYCVWQGGELVAAASMEKKRSEGYAEMTDFAVQPEFRGRCLAEILLHEMERSAVRQDIRTAFSIARAVSWGMNACFARQGYSFSGMLPNNTNICNALESMNVWHKTLCG